MKLLPLMPIYVLVALAGLAGLAQLLFPRWVARWDFHYSDRENPSPRYLLKCRATGAALLVFLPALLFSMYWLSLR